MFTSGCTGALKLLSDSFPFTPDVTSLPSKDSKNVRQISTTSGAHEEIATHKKHVWYQGSEGDCITAPQEFWSSGQSVFCYLEDNHTSVVGMREVAARRGAGLACVTREDVLSSASNVTGVGGDTLKPGVGGDTLKPGVGGDTLKPGVGGDTLKPGVGGNTLKPEDIETAQCQKEDGSAGNNMFETRPHTSPDFTRRSDVYHLFAYPAQSNFSGHKYPLSWTRDVPSGGVVLRGMEGLLGAWLVLLDAAAYVPTSPLDLASFPAHFVTLSFYKMFGFPTGLGALLVRQDVTHLLHKDYYGGGTVLASISRKNFHIAKPQLHERLGDPKRGKKGGGRGAIFMEGGGVPYLWEGRGAIFMGGEGCHIYGGECHICGRGRGPYLWEGEGCHIYGRGGVPYLWRRVPYLWRRVPYLWEGEGAIFMGGEGCHIYGGECHIYGGECHICGRGRGPYLWEGEGCHICGRGRGCHICG